MPLLKSSDGFHALPRFSRDGLNSGVSKRAGVRPQAVIKRLRHNLVTNQQMARNLRQVRQNFQLQLQTISTNTLLELSILRFATPVLSH